MPVAYKNLPSALTGGNNFHVDPKGKITLSESTKAKLNEQSIPYLPTWNKNEKYEPYEFVEYHDKALKADKNLPNLFPKGSKYEIENLSPKFGSEIKGIQLSELNDAGKDELAYLASQRGVLVFRDQDLISKGPKEFTDYVRYYGELHIHPASGAPKDVPDVHSVLTGNTTNDPFANRNRLVQIHSDVSYELNPTVVSFLAVTNNPKSGGGDTLFIDNREAYNRLSPLFKEKLSDLYAVHSAVDQANQAIVKGGVVRRHPVENIHPVVRTTTSGQKVLYVNSGFTKNIVGLKAEESDFLLDFLLQHISNGHDFQIKASYKPDTVIVFNNSLVSHSSILDFETEDPRLIIRVAAKGERPVHDLKDLNKPDQNILYEGPEYLGPKLEDLKLN
ncbi:hypothetical protein KGF54_003505 [Candida jiufengensis]|uniref:uncharacterized protein n=1 Tax=Candida jiufengensis TaxID=497108 RepID=UPI002224424C|nr:uncharacterized protein KGF54_003505 [Candida jiufengensis]KAI5952638.1 hypothetical protein KGF54_003505 [Candida jiufengensis]